MAFTIDQSKLVRTSEGSRWKITGVMTPGAYTTGGYPLLASQIGLSQITGFQIDQEGGFFFDPEVASSQTVANIKVFAPTGVISATALDTETITVVDDATAATKNLVYAARTNGKEWELQIETLPTGAAQPGSFGFVTTSLANTLAMKRGTFSEFKVNVTNNAAPPAGQELRFRPTEFRNGVTVGILCADHAAASVADWDFTCVDLATGLVAQEQIPVIKDPNAADGTYRVGWVPGAADGARIVVESQFSEVCYVRSQSGRYMKLVSGGGGDPIFFNDAAASSNVRLESVGATGSNLMLSVEGDNSVDGITKLPLRVVQTLTAGVVVLQASPSVIAPAGELIKIRLNDRVIDATVTGIVNGVPLFYDAAAAIGSRFRANMTVGNKSLRLSPSERPQGYQPEYSGSGPGSEVANGTDLSSLGEVEFEAWGL